MRDLDDIFDDKKLKKSVRKARIKSTIKITVIAIIVFIFGSIANTMIGLKFSAKKYEENEAYVKLSVPNAYISESNDIIGFLGGNGTYKISKNIGGKSIILEDRRTFFGIVPPRNFFRVNGGGYHVAGEWPVNLWEYGYKKLRFFHPELEYKEYQNDLETIDKIPDGKVIEMAISFDKAYKVADMFKIQTDLEPAIVNWVWLNEFTEEKMQEYKYEVDNYDAKANGIEEYEAIGIPAYSGDNFAYNSYNQDYDEMLDRLSKSYMQDHKKLYDTIMERGKTKADDAEILGVVIQGTKEELKQLIGNPMIKATCFGVVVDPVY